MNEPAPGGPDHKNLQRGASGKAPQLNSRPSHQRFNPQHGQRGGDARTVNQATTVAGGWVCQKTEPKPT